MAETVVWVKDAAGALEQLTLTSSTGSVTYAYDAANQRLTRDGETLISGIQTFTFTAYAYTYDPVADRPDFTAIPATTTSVSSIQNETKMVQISLSALRSRNSLANATNTVVSARFVLRNKDMT
jgi:hypothetical protein